MKTVNVVAALIINQDKVFATQRGYGEFKDGGNFLAARSSLGKHRKRPSNGGDSGRTGHGNLGGKASHHCGIRLSHSSIVKTPVAILKPFANCRVYDIKTPRLIQFNYFSADFAA